jgi:hypothetical protein
MLPGLSNRPMSWRVVEGERPFWGEDEEESPTRGGIKLPVMR